MKKFIPNSVANLLKRFQYQGGSMRMIQPKAGGAVTNPDDDRPAWRYPTPGSKPHPHIPHGPVERSYDIKYYPRDSRRNPWNHVAPEATFFKVDTNKHLTQAQLIEEPKRGSPGNNNPDVMRYNPDGLRTAMTATHEAMEAELAKHRPTQLCTFEWEGRVEEVIASYEDHGIPPVPGRRPKAMDQNARRFDKRW